MKNIFSTATCVRRSPLNPLLSADRMPFDASLVFNAGVAKYQGRYVMLFRNDYGATEADFLASGKRGVPFKGTNIGLAESADGIHWEVREKPVWEVHDDEILRVYDPRLTVIDGKAVICFAMDTRHGLRGGVAVTEDFDRFEIKSLSVPDNRNMVLFPEKIGGRYFRLERPMPVYSRNGAPEQFDLWCSVSPDLVFWGDSRLVLGAETVPFCDAKIGPAAPPVKTSRGWLTTFHAVKYADGDLASWHLNWRKIYYAGLMLLALDDPSKVIGICDRPLLVPETPYEKVGFRGEVIFPGGMILEESGEVKIYYGAADTVECLATADVGDLLALVGAK